MTHCYQFLNHQGEALFLADVDDNICREVLKREPDPNHFCFEFNVVSLAVSTFDYDLDTLLLDIDSPCFPLSLVEHRNTFAAVVAYLIRKGISTRAWVEANHRR